MRISTPKVVPASATKGERRSVHKTDGLPAVVDGAAAEAITLDPGYCARAL
jgi:hypothetical protein